MILPVTYREKGYSIWGKTSIYIFGKNTCIIYRGACGKTYLLKVSCPLYRLNSCSIFHLTVLYYTTLYMYGVLLWVLVSL